MSQTWGGGGGHALLLLKVEGQKPPYPLPCSTGTDVMDKHGSLGFMVNNHLTPRAESEVKGGYGFMCFILQHTR